MVFSGIPALLGRPFSLRRGINGDTSRSRPDIELEIGGSSSAPSAQDADPDTSTRAGTAFPDAGDANEGLRAEFESQNRRHAARFDSVLARAHDAQSQLADRVEEQFDATRTAFKAARAVRERKETELREELERADEKARERLQDRVLQLCAQHDRQAYLGLAACVRFAETVLAGEIAISRSVLLRVRAQVLSENRDGVADSAVLNAGHTQLSDQVRKALIPNEESTRDPLDFAWDPADSTDSEDPASSAQHQGPSNGALGEETPDERPVGSEAVPWPPASPNPAHPAHGEEDRGPSPPPDGLHPMELGLIAECETQFSDLEGDRKRQWRSLQEQHDADITLWRNRFAKLLRELAGDFVWEHGPQSPENLVRAADENDRTSARWASATSEMQCEQEQRRLWKQTKSVFALHRESFVEHLRAAERGLESEEYKPPALGPILPWETPSWIPGPIRMVPASGVAPRLFFPPLSAINLLRAPRVSQGLPTVSARAQMRAAFRDAQAGWEQRFERTIAVIEAESQTSQRKHASTLATELRSWRAQAATAEHEREAQHAQRITVARQEWAEYRVQRARDANELVKELDDEVFKAREAREAQFRSDVQKLHDDFMRVVKDL